MEVSHFWGADLWELDTYYCEKTLVKYIFDNMRPLKDTFKYTLICSGYVLPAQESIVKMRENENIFKSHYMLLRHFV